MSPVSPDSFRQDFSPPSYISGELKRIAIIAGVMVLILAILSIIL